MEKKNKSYINYYSIAALVIAVLIMTGCKSKPAEDTSKLNADVPVSVTKVEKNEVSLVKTFSGTLEGVEQSVIVAKIGERVTGINNKVNDYVKSGQVIIQLDKSGPSSSYLQTQANYENAQKNYERMKALLEEGAISQQQLDQAKTAFDVAKANYDAAKSTVDLTTPINGVLTDVAVNIGDWVNPGMQLATVANISSMIVKFYVSEAEVQKIKLGDHVKVYSQFGENDGVTGTISEISRSASADARSFQVKARFSNTKDSFYKPGMFVNVDVTLEAQNDVLVVPTSAVIYTNNKSLVYKIVNNEAFGVEIKPGISNDNYTEVLGGLNEGDMVVTAGTNNLQDSTKVSIVK